MNAIMRYETSPVEYMDTFVSSNDIRPMQNSYVSLMGGGGGEAWMIY